MNARENALLPWAAALIAMTFAWPVLAMTAAVPDAPVAPVATAVPCLAPTTQSRSVQLANRLREAKGDIKANKFADAITALKDAEGIAGKTCYDQAVIYHMLTLCYIKTDNHQAAAKTMEAELSDGFTPIDGPLLRGIAQANYMIKNYDKTIEFGQRAINAGAADEQIRVLVGQAYFLKGDWKGALAFEETLVDSQIKAGETPKKQSLQLILATCVKLNEPVCVSHARERMATYYPDR